MSNIGIYVDLDETLIHGFHPGDGRYPSDESVKSDFETAYIESDNYLIVLRPGTKEFLKSLQSISPNIFILTAGQVEFQTQVASKIGILNLVKGIYGRDSKVNEVPKFGEAILVDDLGFFTPNTYYKLLQMGILYEDEYSEVKNTRNYEFRKEFEKTYEKYYVLIPPFTAEDKNDNKLSTMVSQVKERLDSIKKVTVQEKIVNYFTEKVIIDVPKQ